MSRSSLDKVLQHVRNVAVAQNAVALSDAELLRAFASQNDQAAFAALVKRHGPFVLAICRRVLYQLQDAEDAFQATFIVLARHAGKLGKKTSLGGWLHRVAYRLALDARKKAARRRRHEQSTRPMNPPNPAWQAAWREVQLVLDEEIQRLPEKYREPFILCCLENQSCAAAARRLKLKEGTVWSRLAEARMRLQNRLSRRGVELTAVLGAAALTPQITLGATLAAKTASAAASKALTAGLISENVALLVQGMTTGLALKKVALATLMLLAVSVAVGVKGISAYHASARGEAAAKKNVQVSQPAINKEQPDIPPKKDVPLLKDGFRSEQRPICRSPSGYEGAGEDGRTDRGILPRGPERQSNVGNPAPLGANLELSARYPSARNGASDPRHHGAGAHRHPPARALLESLAQGAPAARETGEAKSSLERMRQHVTR